MSIKKLSLLLTNANEVNFRYQLINIVLIIGILVTKLVYHFEPLKNWNPFKKKDNMMLIPTVNNNHLGFYFKLNL